MAVVVGRVCGVLDVPSAAVRSNGNRSSNREETGDYEGQP